MQVGLKPLIDAFKSLQLIIHVMLINEYTFESQMAFFDTLLKIANFEVFEPDDLLSKTLPVLDEHASINPKFEDSGYQYSDFILNLG